MVQCTAEHFNFNEKTSQLFASLNLQEAFCPPLNHELVVKGKMSSNVFKQFRVIISRCMPSANSTCVNDTVYNFMFPSTEKLTVEVPIVQYNINAGSQIYKDIYVEDKNIFLLSNKLGISSTVSLETTTIDTDVSIMPYTQKQIENITRVTKAFHKDYYLLPG